MITALAAAIVAIVAAIHDGDTFTAHTAQGPETVRILDIDTPEMPPLARCPAEARKASAARDRLMALMPPGTRIRLTTTARRRDRYGRLLAVVTLPDGRGAGRVLVAEGLARNWRGRREPWCGAARR